MTDPLIFSKSSFEKDFAFSMDFGSSAIKLVHTAEDGDNLMVNFTRFPKADFDKALEFIKEKCGDKLDPESEFSVCGVGASREIQKITETLGIKLKVCPEGDTGLEAVSFMAKQLPWDSIVYPPYKEADVRGAVLAQHYSDIIQSASHGRMTPWPYMSDVEGNNKRIMSQSTPKEMQFPIILAGIGSGFMVGKMEANGNFLPCTSIDGPAGRTFLGLGSLLTGTKTFTELAELAERGDPSTVDQWLANINVNPDDDLYNKMSRADLKLFAFGHAAEKNLDDFKKEDLAAAILSLILSSAAETTFYWASYYKIKQVFFCGGVAASTPHVRHELEKEFSARRFANSQGHECECRILKHGAHLGALGLLLKNLGLKGNMS